MKTEPVTLDWQDGQWLNEPVATEGVGRDLVVTAVQGSDLWRTTAYGFVHDSGHALLHALAPGEATEVSFVLDYGQQFDQAGVLLRSTEAAWLKAGVEISDGVAQVGAVVTHGLSDWSVAPVPHWPGSLVTVRVSRGDDAVTVRAKGGTDSWRLVRVAPWPVDAPTRAGPYCCAPTRSGLRVRFTNWSIGPADGSLHPSA
jgi:uncharacterized protein